jgi:hypothetical protein
MDALKAGAPASNDFVMLIREDFSNDYVALITEGFSDGYSVLMTEGLYLWAKPGTENFSDDYVALGAFQSITERA